MTDEAKLTVGVLRYCEESGARCGGCPSGTDENGVPNCHSQAHIADLIESLSAELERVKRERDAAVEDIYSMKACALCKHYPNGEQCETYFLLCCECDIGNCICKECVNGEKMEWRGVQEEHK